MKNGRHFLPLLLSSSMLGFALVGSSLALMPLAAHAGDVYAMHDDSPMDGIYLPESYKAEMRDRKAKAAKNGQVPPALQALQAAHTLTEEQKYDQALAKLNEFDTLPGKTAEDTYLAERTRMVIAAKTGNTALLTHSMEAALATNFVPTPEKKDFYEQLARTYYKQKDYATARTAAKHYLSEGGNDPQMQMMLPRAAYLGNDFTTARDEAKASIDADRQAGRKPTEEILRIYAASAGKLNDQAGYTAAMEQFATYYPKPENWSYLLDRMIAKPSFPDRLVLDFYRLMAATGQLNTAKDYTEMADVAMKTGYAIEAKKVLDKGFEAGILGKGADAAKERQMLAQASRATVADLNATKINDLEKAGKMNQLADIGYIYVVNGQADKGLPLMEKAVNSGQLKSPEEVKLHLGVAYLAAGRKDDAAKTFQSIQANGALGDLARYWTIYLNHPV